MRKIPFAGIELTSQRVRRLRGYLCATGATGNIYIDIYRESMDQPGKVANPARGQLNRETENFPVRIRA